MKHLIHDRPAPFGIVMGFLVLLSVLIAAPAALAGGIQFTTGSGMAEGDPTDGLDYSGGGAGDLIGDSSSIVTNGLVDTCCLFSLPVLVVPQYDFYGARASATSLWGFFHPMEAVQFVPSYENEGEAQ